VTVDKTKLKPTGFILKKPDKTRKTFQIIPYQRIDGKKVYGFPLEHEALTALNSSFAKGQLSASEALMHVKKVLIPKLKNKFEMPEKLVVETRISEHNLRVYKDFWSAVYRRKKIRRPETARSQFLKALYYFEPLSLHSSDIDDIQDHWDKKLKETSHKRYGGRINQLLAFLKRGFQINLDAAKKPQLKWVTWEELEKINERVSNPVLRDLYRALWGTGCRLGEIFPLGPDDLKDNGAIYISKQVDSKLNELPYTKNNINHDTIVLPPAREAVERWLAIQNKSQYRKNSTHPLRDASRAAFPHDRSKWISPHKLRHSFVKFLTSRRVSLNEIKDLIGDTLKTTEDTYAGWVISSDSVDYVMGKIQDAEAHMKKKKKSKN